MLYSASSRFSSPSSFVSSRAISLDATGCSGPVARDQQPDQRKPELARERDRPVVDEHLREIRRSDDFEQIAQFSGLARPEARPVPVTLPGSRFPKLG